VTTDPTPRDVTGEPLRVGRWYWVRDKIGRSAGCIRLEAFDGQGHAWVLFLQARLKIADYDWLPENNPPAWPEQPRQK
jgi:hypothetical protein